MKVTAINSGVTASRPSDVQLRLDAMRKGLRDHGAVMVDTTNKVDLEAIQKLKTQFGDSNVQVQESTNAKLTVKNFQR
jgi:hypothetical protein